MLKNTLSKIVIITSFFITLIFSNNSYAVSPAPEKISNFSTDYVINLDGTVDVTETIDYYFPQNKHGIYRNIPLEKENMDGDIFIMDISGLQVLNESGNSINYFDESTSKELSLKIGDPDEFVIGNKTYVIKYTLHGALSYFSDHDEFYWNVTGDEWVIPIENVTVHVTLPDQITSDTSANCFTGSFKSTEVNCNFSVFENRALYKTSKTLFPGEGITITLFFPTGVVAVLEPTKDTSMFWALLILGVVIGLFYILLPGYLLIKAIKKLKKSEEEKRVVAAWFDPPKNKNGRYLTASEVGILHDKKGDIRDFTAGIVQLAQKGYLRIEETKKGIFSKTDYKLTLTKVPDETLLSHERKILDILFTKKAFSLNKLINAISSGEVTKNMTEDPSMQTIETPEVHISDLSKRTTMSTEISNFYSDISSDLVSDGIFEEDPIKKRNNWTAGLVLSGMFLNPLFLIASLLMMKSAKRTKLGGEGYAVVESMNNFVKSQDKKLEFQAKNQIMFEKLLPYAIALGVEKVWVERFKDIQFTKSDWYVSSSGYNALAFSSFANSFSSSVSRNVSMSSSRSSSGFSSGGGGFSGGGGGGGGGGSW